MAKARNRGPSAGLSRTLSKVSVRSGHLDLFSSSTTSCRSVSPSLVSSTTESRAGKSPGLACGNLVDMSEFRRFLALRSTRAASLRSWMGGGE